MKINCAEAITLLTGSLTVPVERLYTLYNELTGDNLYTHQLPRAFKTCLPHAERAFPKMAEWLRERPINRDNWQQVVDATKQQFGDEFHLEPLTEWQQIDPITEIVAMRSKSEAAQ